MTSVRAIRWAPLLATVAFLDRASHGVLVPPRLDLVPYGRVGLVTFTVENAKGTLHEFATRRFEEAVLQAQTGSATDPNVAYGHLVNRLVNFVTRDFRPTWR